MLCLILESVPHYIIGLLSILPAPYDTLKESHISKL